LAFEDPGRDLVRAPIVLFWIGLSLLDDGWPRDFCTVSLRDLVAVFVEVKSPKFSSTFLGVFYAENLQGICGDFGIGPREPLPGKLRLVPAIKISNFLVITWLFSIWYG
jgi:hypothetical protein